MKRLANLVAAAVRPLVGLPLSSISYAADMRTFQFGELRTYKGGRVGRFALHVQCPWRLESKQGILTGKEDWHEPANSTGEIEGKFDPSLGGSLQEGKLRKVFRGYDRKLRAIINETGKFRVIAATADSLGGFELQLSGGYRLIVFPAGSVQEAWRLFQPGTQKHHFVMEPGLQRRK